MTRGPLQTVRPAAVLTGLFLSLGGCASAGYLAEYDFTDRTLAVTTPAPPLPEVRTGDEVDLDDRSALEAILAVGSEITKEYGAERARARLDSATRRVDVPGRLGARVVEGSARLLGARNAGGERGDFEIEVRIRSWGIEAEGWDTRAAFFLDAEVGLLDRATGRTVWETDVDEREPVEPRAWGAGGPVDNLVTARTLATLTAGEMERALEYLADYCADRVVAKLERGLAKARG